MFMTKYLWLCCRIKVHSSIIVTPKLGEHFLQSLRKVKKFLKVCCRFVYSIVMVNEGLTNEVQPTLSLNKSFGNPKSARRED